MKAVLLPGQAAAPEGPVDLTMMYVLHHGFRRDLARFVVAARRTPPTDVATWAALLERWDLFALLLEDHHHKEDEHVWPLLRSAVAAAGDDQAAAVLDEMETEHATIDPLLVSVREDLARLSRDTDAGARDALEANLVSAQEVLDHHLGHEERDAIALLQRYVAADDWAELERRHLRGGLGPGDLLRLLPWSVQDLPGPVATELLSEAGLPFRVLLRLGRGRYERLDSAAFAHVPVGVVP
jgi:hemerythrin-like domain-containing protein